MDGLGQATQPRRCRGVTAHVQKSTLGALATEFIHTRAPQFRSGNKTALFTTISLEQREGPTTRLLEKLFCHWFKLDGPCLEGEKGGWVRKGTLYVVTGCSWELHGGLCSNS